MKVIGFTGDGWQRKYIVEISGDELKSAFEKSYDSRDFSELKVGAEVNLSDIPGQRLRVVGAVEAMQKAYTEFVKAAPVMAEVARVIGKESRS